MTPFMRLSIAAPAFNESQGIQKIVQQWHDYLCQQTFISQFEIVICNDGSQDNTAMILDELAQRYPEIRPIHLAVNQGAASALTKAIAATQYEWVLLMDSD